MTAVNVVAKLLGHPIHWDTETIGCNPSLSSIPVAEQRTFSSALQEIREWMQQPRNQREFLVLYLDDQPDLKDWVRALFVDDLVIPRGLVEPQVCALRCGTDCGTAVPQARMKSAASAAYCAFLRKFRNCR